MLPENRAFLIRGDDGQEYGPVDLGELREWVQENRAGVGTAVRLDEPNAPWETWQTYPEVGRPGGGSPRHQWPVPAFGDDDRPLGTAHPCFDFRLYSQQFHGFPNPLRRHDLLPAGLGDAVHADAGATACYRLPGGGALCHVGKRHCLLRPGTLYGRISRPAWTDTGEGHLASSRRRYPWPETIAGLRSLVRGFVFSFSFYFYGIPFFYAFFNPERRAAHDFIAGTYVVNA